MDGMSKKPIIGRSYATHPPDSSLTLGIRWLRACARDAISEPILCVLTSAVNNIRTQVRGNRFVQNTCKRQSSQGQ